MTAAELLRLTPGQGVTYELLNGALVVKQFGGYQQGVICARIGAILGDYTTKHRLGDVVASGTGFLLHRDPDHVRAPDCAFVAAGRLPAGPDPVGYADIAPDFVVEVVSPGDTAAHVQEKIVDWLRHGTLVAWSVYPSLREVVVWRGSGQAERRAGEDELDAEPALPGFRCKVSELFAD